MREDQLEDQPSGLEPTPGWQSFVQAEQRGGVLYGKPSLTISEAGFNLIGGEPGWSAALGLPFTVSYAFRATAPSTMPSDTGGFSRFNAAQIAQAELAMAAWSDVANITFVRVGSGSLDDQAYSDSATILFANYATGEDGSAAFASYPGNTSYSSAAGDVWVNSTLNYNTAPSAGNYGALTLIHEIGHAIGLAHPSPYNAASGSSITYADDASYYEDSLAFTVMSYFDETETLSNFNGYYPSAPMLDDISAAQQEYGANYSTRTGDTTYGFNSNAGRAWFSATNSQSALIFAVWDAGGVDTFDFSGFDHSQQIDLQAGHFSSVGSLVGNVAIAENVIIENAFGGSGADTIVGNSAANLLRGGGGDDQINGGDGDDRLEGGAGADLLDGGSGMDVFAAGDGIDVVYTESGEAADGGAGRDTIAINRSAYASSAVDIDLRSLWTGGVGRSNGANLVGFEELLGNIYGSNQSDSIIIGDSYTLRTSTIFGGAGDDLITGGGGSDDLQGEGGVDRLSGAAGDDTLTIDRGDTADGGSGLDTLLIDGSRAGSGALNLDLRGLWSGGSGSNSGALVSNIEIIGALAYGGDGDDVIVIGDGYTRNTIEILGGLGADQLTGSGAADGLNGGSGDDNLYGGAGSDTLYGAAGNDILQGGIGADIMDGGAGDDSYAVDNPGDVVLENAAGGFDAVYASFDYRIGTNIESLYLQGVAVTGYGNAGANAIYGGALANYLDGDLGDDYLSGGSGNDILQGGVGADVMDGGAGDDSYAVDNPGDVVRENTAEGFDAIYASFDYWLGANIEALYLQGAAVTGYGNAGANAINGGALANYLDGGLGDDYLSGGAGNDILQGGIGADVMDGGAGDDSYAVDNPGDVVRENASEGFDAVYAAFDYRIGANIEALYLQGAAVTGYGNAGANAINGGALANYLDGDLGDDYLSGGAGNDILQGGIGADVMDGGTGDDSFAVDNAGDVARENAAEGYDAVYSTVDYALGANLEALVLQGQAIVGIGNNLANALTGNALNNTLSGGGGQDTFIFGPGSGWDTITDFGQNGDHDRIDLTRFSSIGATWTIAQSGGDTLVQISTGDTITLIGVLATSLSQAGGIVGI